MNRRKRAKETLKYEISKELGLADSLKNEYSCAFSGRDCKSHAFRVLKDEKNREKTF